MRKCKRILSPSWAAQVTRWPWGLPPRVRAASMSVRCAAKAEKRMYLDKEDITASCESSRDAERENHAGNDHCSHCNAPGAGGIAVVRLSGAESSHSSPVFRPANAAKRWRMPKATPLCTAHSGKGTKPLMRAWPCFFRAPHSYTGEDVVELSCHGGSAVARRLVEACLAAGAQPAAPGEYTRRAFLNGKLGLTQAEAVMDPDLGGWPSGCRAGQCRAGRCAGKEDQCPEGKRLPPFRLTLPHGWIFPKKMCRSWTVTICTAY